MKSNCVFPISPIPSAACTYNALPTHLIVSMHTYSRCVYNTVSAACYLCCPTELHDAITVPHAISASTTAGTLTEFKPVLSLHAMYFPRLSSKTC